MRRAAEVRSVTTLVAAPPSTLRERLDSAPELQSLLGDSSGVVAGVPSGAASLLAWWLRERTQRPVLVVTTEPELMYGDVNVWDSQSIALFPPADSPAFDRVPPSEAVSRRRLTTLGMLREDSPAIVVTSPPALMRPTLPAGALEDATTALRRGARMPIDELLHRLVALGYRRVTAVSTPGDFAVRGGIVDVFGADGQRPWRAEWFGDDVDEIRVFDVETQESVAKIDAVWLHPARELDLREAVVRDALVSIDSLDLTNLRDDVRESWERDRAHLGEGMYEDGVDLFLPYLAGPEPPTLLDHLREPIVLLAGGEERLRRVAERHAEEIEALRDQEQARGELPRDARSGVISPSLLFPRLRAQRHIETVREADPHVRLLADLGWRGVDGFAGEFDSFARAALEAFRLERSVLAVSRQQHRVEELAGDQGVSTTDAGDLSAAGTPLTAGALVVAGGDLSQGFSAPSSGVDVFTDTELFGARKRRGSMLARGARRAESTSARGRRRAATERAAREAFALDFAPGDVVVHRDHGIARFVEMRTVTDDFGAEHEYMILEYADSDRLFVPVEHLDRVDRYVGGADSHPSLSRLGTGEWERAKRRVKERTEEVARELLTLYSRRESAPGHAYAPDGAWQQELESSFPYEETPDQVLVMEDIRRDMEASRPMDRVVCGDVGFGKTELALRAAFKAAVEGRQVAMLVPTTVLCQQHFLTFSERLAPFPVTVRQLSRFCTDRDAAETLVGLKSGGVDIVIGTHRLLQRDVAFRNLGLVIIDEEQRFGVLQKERFKELRVAVDVLSLSATPIPRTLHMSLAGIRDLSVIQTPPEERQPIKTYVTAREEGLLREVITRELARGGQIFYVHNRVQTIQGEADRLRALVPEARIEVAHGQMPENALATVMRAFTTGDVDVLACTTIIESGLDIPNANTIIINDSHRLGLAQLYQLRGRVGRAGQRAYAYLLYPPLRSLTERADKRLEVIADLQDLGSGFKLAMRDLEIRGAGNLLGEEQHGEIAAVGLEMYNRLLSQAVGSLQGRPVVESPAQVTVSLPLRALLPENYVTDLRLRLRCYQELAECTTEQSLEARARGLVDRFGPLPKATEALVYTLRVRLLAAAANALAVESERGKDVITIRLPLEHGVDLPALSRQFGKALTFSPTRLYLSRQGAWQEALVGLLRELGRLERARQRIPA